MLRSLRLPLPSQMTTGKTDHPFHLSFFSNALHYAREGRRPKMIGARGFKRQGDIGKFDLAAARNFYHHRRRFYGSGRGASVECKGGRTGDLKSVCSRRDLGTDEGDVVSMGAPGVRIEIPLVFRQDPTIRQFHVQLRGEIRLA